MATQESNLERLRHQARDGWGKAGGDINGPPELHYACSVAEGLHLIAEAVATGALAIVEAMATHEGDTDAD